MGWRLLAPHGDDEHHEAPTTFAQALRLIILADVVMSLDNVLTVAGAAHGNIWLLVIGLALSIPLLFVGSGLIALATERLPLIIYAGSALIFRIALVLIIDDPALHERLIVEDRETLNFIIAHVIPWLAAIAGPALYVLVARWRGRRVLPIWAGSSDTRDAADESPGAPSGGA